MVDISREKERVVELIHVSDQRYIICHFGAKFIPQLSKQRILTRAQIYLSDFMQAELPKLSVARIRGTYLFRTSYATVGILYDRVGYLWKVVIERASEIERILDNHHEYGYPENPLTYAGRRGSHREFIEDASEDSC
ncbi:hypothetical protein G5I_05277 [Acromyrmex echinatior]|uniref:Uncharacterized protein n=1 Tax=Acromyrmex echinatior TaxID=103372 RepID=F4WI08_ACREC|nr:hypothetical protein G5I_05277 [Acromyrmex echinatior]